MFDCASDPNTKIPIYVEPSDSKPKGKEAEPKKTSEAEDEKLAEEAKEKAKAAPKVSKAERVKRVLVAENQRPKTEKETHLLEIDENFPVIATKYGTRVNPATLST